MLQLCIRKTIVKAGLVIGIAAIGGLLMEMEWPFL